MIDHKSLSVILDVDHQSRKQQNDNGNRDFRHRKYFVKP